VTRLDGFVAGALFTAMYVVACVVLVLVGRRARR
jgi:hypothetical protein